MKSLLIISISSTMAQPNKLKIPVSMKSNLYRKNWIRREEKRKNFKKGYCKFKGIRTVRNAAKLCD